jgi:hypothetical protein
MSDRPSAVNGKRNRAWGTRDACPACGQCLCFGCHPAGPCVDEQASLGFAAPATGPTRFSASAGTASSFSGRWLPSGPSGTPRASALRMRAATDPVADRLRS